MNTTKNGTGATALPQGPATTPAEALASDPRRLGWMQGFPPPAERLIRFDAADLKFPKNRWSFSHYRELMPTANIWRGNGPVSVLPHREQDLDGIRFQLEGRFLTWSDMLALTYTDGILVLHRGEVIYERYFGALEPHLPHIGMSVTKSFVGTLAAMQAEAGQLDPAAPVCDYLPELAATAYRGATVRQVMDMLIGVRYSEDYVDPHAEVRAYARAAGLVPRRPDEAGPTNIYDFLKTLEQEGAHGDAFAYKTINTEVLAWIVRRQAGKSLAQLVSEVLWQPLGAEHDGYFIVDSTGTEAGGSGLNTTLRDLARFGEMMRCGGYFNGRQIVPQSVIEDIRRGGDAEKFAKTGRTAYPTLPGYSYRNMWWVAPPELGIYQARGIHGQRIYIDPKAELTIVRYASHPVAANPANDPPTHAAFAALAVELAG